MNIPYFWKKFSNMRLTQFMNDKWVLIIGIPFIGIIMPLIFNRFSFDFLFSEGYRNTLFSLATTVAIWLGIRKIVIFLWEKYPWEKYPARHLIYEILMVTSYTMFIGFLSYLIAFYTDFVDLDPDMAITISVAITLLVTYLITCIHEAWFFFTQWNISLVKAQALEKENIQSQYEVLKGQINPHFLFNTLNTLTNLIEESPKTAVGYVEKTADFMRNLLAMKDKEIITLKEELKIIDTFYHLQKERFGENLKMNISVSDQLHNKKLPPLSVQMLVENAIKHNIISSDKPLTIEITGNPEGKLIISNNLQRKPADGKASGIGLQNIRNRFRFFTDQKVEITETVDSFKVKLPLLS